MATATPPSAAALASLAPRLGALTKEEWSGTLLPALLKATTRTPNR